MKHVLMKFINYEIDVHIPYAHFLGKLHSKVIDEQRFFYLDTGAEFVYINPEVVTAVEVKKPS